MEVFFRGWFLFTGKVSSTLARMRSYGGGGGGGALCVSIFPNWFEGRVAFRFLPRGPAFKERWQLFEKV